MRSLKKSSSSFSLLLRYLKPELWAFLCWITKWRAGVWGQRKEKVHTAICTVLFHPGRHSPREKAVSALSISEKGSHVSPDEEHSLWKSHPKGQAPATNITAASEAHQIDCAWAGRGLEALPWSPQPTGAQPCLQRKEFSFHQPKGIGERKMRTMVSFRKPTFPCLQVTWRRAMGITWFPKKQCNHRKSLAAKPQQKQLGSTLSWGSGTAEFADRGLWGTRVPASIISSKAGWMPAVSPPGTQVNKEILKMFCMLGTSSLSSFFCPSCFPYPESTSL